MKRRTAEMFIAPDEETVAREVADAAAGREIVESAMGLIDEFRQALENDPLMVGIAERKLRGWVESLNRAIDPKVPFCDDHLVMAIAAIKVSREACVLVRDAIMERLAGDT